MMSGEQKTSKYRVVYGHHFMVRFTCNWCRNSCVYRDVICKRTRRRRHGSARIFPSIIAAATGCYPFRCSVQSLAEGILYFGLYCLAIISDICRLSISRVAALIIGLGSDLCNIERIQNSLDRFGTRFENRVFTNTERAKAARRPFTMAGTYAKRFAAKEAFSKAVGTGFKRGVFMKDIGVINAPSGAPTLALTGGAKARLDAMIPSGYEAHVHLTLTDDHPWAQAFVIIEALPTGPAHPV